MTELNPTALEAATKALYECEESLSGAEYVVAAISAYLANLPQTPTDHTDLIDRMRRASTAVYIAVEEVVADDLSDMLRRAAAALEASRPLTPSAWVNTLGYAATALEASSDNGDQYAARQIRQHLAALTPSACDHDWRPRVSGGSLCSKCREWIDKRFPLTPSADEYREAYESWKASGQKMHAALLAIWHMTEQGDTSHMTYGDDPQAVLESVRAALTPETGDVREALADLIAEERDKYPRRADDMDSEELTAAILARFTVTDNSGLR